MSLTKKTNKLRLQQIIIGVISIIAMFIAGDLENVLLIAVIGNGLILYIMNNHIEVLEDEIQELKRNNNSYTINKDRFYT